MSLARPRGVGLQEELRHERLQRAGPRGGRFSEPGPGDSKMFDSRKKGRLGQAGIFSLPTHFFRQTFQQIICGFSVILNNLLDYCNLSGTLFKIYAILP